MVHALRDVTFRLEPGVTAVLGANGAGKTTLLRLTAGILSPSQGRVRWQGVPLTRRSRGWWTGQLGYLPQDFNTYPHLTVGLFLRYMATLKRIPPDAARRQCNHLLQLLGLTEQVDRRIGTLSLGTKRRVGLAQALLGDPGLLVLDEPTTSLDPTERLRFMQFIDRRQQDRVVLISTHNLGEIARYSDNAIIIGKGRVVRLGFGVPTPRPASGAHLAGGAGVGLAPAAEHPAGRPAAGLRNGPIILARPASIFAP